jgi:hypothetical protein
MANNDYSSLVSTRVSGAYDSFQAAHSSQKDQLDAEVNFKVLGFKFEKWDMFKDKKKIDALQNFEHTIRAVEDAYSKAMETMSRSVSG